MNSDTRAPLKRTPLYDKHLELGARVVPFAGWEMPLQYSGMIDEHLATRDSAGIFDICHMGEFLLSGKDAISAADNIVTCSVDGLPVGKCRYGFMLNTSGGIIDDLIVFRTKEDQVMLVVNAGTCEKDLSWIKSKIAGEARLDDISERTAKIDVQGPVAADIISGILGDAVNDLGRFSFTECVLDGIEILLSRTGYTGENGFELFFSSEMAPQVWDVLASREGVVPVGLGARDTLRLEMGYSLYGNEINEELTPVDAGLMRFVDMRKDFIGKKVLEERSGPGKGLILKGFICEGRRSARSHYKVIVNDEEAGEVTSGAFSPSMKRAIGMCYVRTSFGEDGQSVVLTDGRAEIKAEITSPPMLKR